MMSKSLNLSWEPFRTSIFSEMSALALREGAVNLAQGFPDFDAPNFVIQPAVLALQNNRNQYAPATGLPGLREAVSKRHLEKSGLHYDPEQEITVVSGATEGIFVTIQALCNPGDEVIVFEPFYDSYPAALHAAHAVLKPIPLMLEEDSTPFDAEALKAAITDKTKAIFINTPHNPTGKVFSKTELEGIAQIALERDLWVISDEVYDELTFAPATHLSIATLPQMQGRTVVITSSSKTFSVTGWKVGFVAAPEQATRLIRAVHQFNVFCSSTPLQFGVMSALKEAQTYYPEFRKFYTEKRDLMLEILKNCGWKCHTPEGAYFILADYSHLSSEEDVSFAKRLTREGGLATIPISVFFKDQKAAQKKHKILRFAFCKTERTLTTAGLKLDAFRGRI